MDSVPLVAITGQVVASLIGTDGFQEADIVGITLPVTKHNYLVTDADDIPRVIAEAFHIARSGRPGPVHVDITKDALQAETHAAHPSEADVIAGLPGFRPTMEGNYRQLKLAAAEIQAAERPVILAGHGVHHAGAEAELRAVLDDDPDDVLAMNNLGYNLADQGRKLDEAEAMVRRAVELDREKKIDAETAAKQNAAYLDSLGWVLFKKQDLKKAKEYLQKAGTPDGFTLNVMTSQGLYSTAVDEAQNVQAQLGKVGIKVNVQALDSNAYVQKWLAGDFDAAIAQNAGSADPNTMYARYFTTGGTYNKVAGYSSPELDSLFAEGIATTDTAKRKAVYEKLSKELVDNAAWIWLFTPKEYIVLNSSVNGFEARYDADVSTLWKATLS